MSSPSRRIPIYIINVHPLLINNDIVWDVFYLTESSSAVNCLRIFNIQLSFLVARLPGLTPSQFETFMKHNTNGLRVLMRNDLVDSAYFNPFGKREYAEIFSASPTKLRSVHDHLYRVFESVYGERLKHIKLSPDDELFYNNTETPFRYTSTTLTVSTSIYNLSTKYGVPLVGGAELDMSKVTREYPNDFLPDRFVTGNMYGLDAQLPRCRTETSWTYENVNGNIRAALTKNDAVDFKRNMTMIAYDIETWNENGDLDPTNPDYYIFCIGVGVFNLTDQCPYKRLCIISKDFDRMDLQRDMEYGDMEDGREGDHNDDIDGDHDHDVKDSHDSLPLPPDDSDDLTVHPVAAPPSHHPLRTIPLPIATKPSSISPRHRSYVVTAEYTSPSSPHPYDSTEYIIAHDEADLLSIFISIIDHYHPQIITGFNSFGFDDNYVYHRMSRHNLTSDYLQLFTPYSLVETAPHSWFRPFTPSHRQFELKIDNEPRIDNHSVRAHTILTVDVYKLLLKEDPKRFTQYGSGKLNNMLDVYDVRNPFTSRPLSKTGLTIAQMYERWSASRDIYSIALYCCQDAWICGTLLIKRAKLTDLIEMSSISSTTLSDSLYRADGQRVAHSILTYAYTHNFAIMDSPSPYRHDFIHHPDTTPHTPLGRSTPDTRTIVGGAVRNAHPAKHPFVVALDYSSMYPSSKEGSNIDTSSRLPSIVLTSPSTYSLSIVRRVPLNDVYGRREVIYLRRVAQSTGPSTT